MKHSATRTLFDYWDNQRGDRVAPDRADIDPAAIRTILADTFVLAADFVGEDRFRLAGTKVCALFGRELKDTSFVDLWGASSRKQIEELLTIVNEESLGVVAGATGLANDGNAVELEFSLLPLARRGHARVRSLGVLAPLTTPYWIGVHAVRELRLGAMRHVGPEVDTVAPSLVAVPPGGRMTASGLVVYEGGRTTETTEEPSTAA
jgi:hypothetical protein